jgi:peroxin-19
MATTADGEDLDDILDQALDDLEQADIRVTGEEPKKETVASPSAAPSSGLAMDPNELFQFLTGNDNGPVDEEGDAKLDQFMKHLQSTMKDTETNSKKATSSTKGSQATRKVPSGDNTDNNTEDVAATLASILEQMTTMDRDDYDDDDFAAGGLNPDAIVDGMMEQLLSKDLMYEPMKHVADEFPAWLDGKKDSLPKAELAK